LKGSAVAGARRLAALKLLAKRKELAKDVDIGFSVLDAEDDAEISLAENEMRVAMHPADQLEAFKRLVDEGRSVEESGSTRRVARQPLSDRERPNALCKYP
jgi:ParB family chromosome partitioning protein